MNDEKKPTTGEDDEQGASPIGRDEELERLGLTTAEWLARDAAHRVQRESADVERRRREVAARAAELEATESVLRDPQKSFRERLAALVTVDVLRDEERTHEQRRAAFEVRDRVLRTSEEREWIDTVEGRWKGNEHEAIDVELVMAVVQVDAWLSKLKAQAVSPVEVENDDADRLFKLAENLQSRAGVKPPPAEQARWDLLHAVDAFATHNAWSASRKGSRPISREHLLKHKRALDSLVARAPTEKRAHVQDRIVAVIKVWNDPTPRRAAGLLKGTVTKRTDREDGRTLHVGNDDGGRWGSLEEILTLAGFEDVAKRGTLRVFADKIRNWRVAGEEPSETQRKALEALARPPPKQSAEFAAERAEYTQRLTPTAQPGTTERAPMATAKKTPAPKATAKKAAAKRMGRPPKPEGERRTASLKLRLHPEERAELEAGAERLGETLTELVLTSVRERLERS